MFHDNFSQVYILNLKSVLSKPNQTNKQKTQLSKYYCLKIIYSKFLNAK